MGFIDIDRSRDEWNHEWLGMGAASTTNPSVVYEEEPKANPIGFIWTKEENSENVQHRTDAAGVGPDSGCLVGSTVQACGEHLQQDSAASPASEQDTNHQ